MFAKRIRNQQDENPNAYVHVGVDASCGSFLSVYHYNEWFLDQGSTTLSVHLHLSTSYMIMLLHNNCEGGISFQLTENEVF